MPHAGWHFVEKFQESNWDPIASQPPRLLDALVSSETDRRTDGQSARRWTLSLHSAPLIVANLPGSGRRPQNADADWHWLIKLRSVHVHRSTKHRWCNPWTLYKIDFTFAIPSLLPYRSLSRCLSYPVSLSFVSRCKGLSQVHYYYYY